MPAPPRSRWWRAPSRRKAAAPDAGGLCPGGIKTSEADAPPPCENPGLKTRRNIESNERGWERKRAKKESNRSSKSFSSCWPSCFGFGSKAKGNPRKQSEEDAEQIKDFDDAENDASTAGGRQGASTFSSFEECDGEVSPLPVSADTHFFGAQPFASCDLQHLQGRDGEDGAALCPCNAKKDGFTGEGDLGEAGGFFDDDHCGEEREPLYQEEYFLHIDEDNIITAGLSVLCGGERTTWIIRYHADDMEATSLFEEENESEEELELGLKVDLKTMFLQSVAGSLQATDCPRGGLSRLALLGDCCQESDLLLPHTSEVTTFSDTRREGLGSFFKRLELVSLLHFFKDIERPFEQSSAKNAQLKNKAEVTQEEDMRDEEESIENKTTAFRTRRGSARTIEETEEDDHDWERGGPVTKRGGEFLTPVMTRTLLIILMFLRAYLTCLFMSKEENQVTAVGEGEGVESLRPPQDQRRTTLSISTPDCSREKGRAEMQMKEEKEEGKEKRVCGKMQRRRRKKRKGKRKRKKG